MKEISDLLEIKKIELDILLAFHAFCEDHSLKYYMAYGTLLGAVRHKGFIPWDDDIDVMMPRSDYEFFIKNFGNDYYKVLSLAEKDYYYPFAKVCDMRTVLVENTTQKIKMGVYIDVFPLDGVSPNNKVSNFKIKHLLHLQRHKYSSLSRKRNLLKKLLLPIVKVLLSPISLHKLGSMINDESRKTSFDKSNLVGCVMEDAERNLFFEKELLEPFCYLDFEGHLFRAPAQTDEYLKIIYGNYMCLPPIEKQISKHDFKVYQKEGETSSERD